jgi:hypothetical protein
MRKYKKVVKDELDDILCDVCGASCVPKRDEGSVEFDASWAEFAVLEANWGYMSRKDGDRANYEICEKCFDKIVVFIGSISVGDALD